MRVFDQVRNRRTNQIAAGTDHDQTAFKDETKVSHDVEGSGSDSDNLSLEAKEEKRIQEAPDQVTSDAQAGIQKAEAAALVWSKTAIFGVYAWYATMTAMFPFAPTNHRQDLGMLLHARLPVLHPELRHRLRILGLHHRSSHHHRNDPVQHHRRCAETTHRQADQHLGTCRRLYGLRCRLPHWSDHLDRQQWSQHLRCWLRSILDRIRCHLPDLGHLHR